MDLWKTDPKRNVEGFINDVIRTINVNVSKDQAYRAKRLALRKLEGSVEEQFAKLWSYCEELRKSNPGSTVVLSTDDSDGSVRFSRIYVCFEALKAGWKAGCRPFIRVDGCHLSGPSGGVLLTAIGVDPQNRLYPIAYVVVSIENRDTWEWFLTILKQDLQLHSAEAYTFMSDKQKGLIQAMQEVFPGAEHRFCVRHMWKNMYNAGFRGEAFKQSLWSTASASTIGEFKRRLKIIQDLDAKTYEWLQDRPPEQWAKSHFSTQSKCDMILNNCCESFNACIVLAREKPILICLEWIREYIMKRLQVNRDKAKMRWRDERICLQIKLMLQKNAKQTSNCIPIKADDRRYQISCSDGSQHCVDLEQWTCTCWQWDLTGLPCCHAIRAIQQQNHSVNAYVSDYYNVHTYLKVYEPTIMGVCESEIWDETNYIPSSFGKKAGRPKKARRRGIEEPTSHQRKKKERISANKDEKAIKNYHL